MCSWAIQNSLFILYGIILQHYNTCIISRSIISLLTTAYCHSVGIVDVTIKTYSYYFKNDCHMITDVIYF